MWVIATRRKDCIEYDRLLFTLIVLALDTTTRGGSVAVAEDDRVLALLAGDESRTHGERLPGEIARALEQAGVPRERIDLLGGRDGARRVHRASHWPGRDPGPGHDAEKPVIGVSALDALAEQVVNSHADLLIPWMDAQRGDVFATLIDRQSGTTVEPPTAASPKALLESWHAQLSDRRAIFIGDAVARDTALIVQTGSGKWDTQAPSPLAVQIAVIGRRRANNGEAGPPHRLEPIYVRRPDAEIEREIVAGRRPALSETSPPKEAIVESKVERISSTQDLDAVLEIEDASFNNPTTRDWYEGELKRPEVCFIYVLRLSDLPVAAFCAFWLVADQAHINNLAVRPELRGRGLGTHLLESIVEEARHLGAASLTLEVRRSNIAAQRLYAKSGFHEAGVRKSYYTQPVEDALILRRKIS